MILVIVGAGHVGWSLTELALHDGHNVMLIEVDQRRAQEASQKYDATVLHANITQGGILDEAWANGSDALVATTGTDPFFVICLRGR